MECEILGCCGGTIDCQGAARYYRLAITPEPLECIKLGANPLTSISSSIKKEIVTSLSVNYNLIN